ncbi:MAG: ABC transporter permease [Alphaproteobacteria bacterium]
MGVLAAFWRRYRRNRAALIGLAIVVVVVIMAFSAPWLFPHDPLRIVGPSELWPMQDARFPLGTDSLGRDVAAGIFYGAGTTLLIGLVASLVATIIGVTIGALAGYYGGWWDDALMRFTEIFQTIPNLIFLLALVAVLGPTIENVVLGIGIISWTSIARLVRAEFMSLRDREFVLAGRAMGMSDLRLIATQILPNAIPPVIVLASLIVAGAVLFESALSFLGLSDPNIASWGRLIGEGRLLIRTSWYICAIPGVAILVTVLALNLIGDGLNDAFNPKLRNR